MRMVESKILAHLSPEKLKALLDKQEAAIVGVTEDPFRAEATREKLASEAFSEKEQPADGAEDERAG